MCNAYVQCIRIMSIHINICALSVCAKKSTCKCASVMRQYDMPKPLNPMLPKPLNPMLPKPLNHMLPKPLNPMLPKPLNPKPYVLCVNVLCILIWGVGVRKTSRPCLSGVI